MTRAIILAAGRGSRMGSMTEAQPKCLASLVGRPLLAWQLEALQQAGVRDIAVVTGYRAELLAPFGGHRFHNERWAETNMVRTLEQAASWLRSGPCLVAYSDIVYRPGHIEALIETSGDLCTTADLLWRELWEARFEDPLADAETFRADASGRLLEIGGRTRDPEAIQGQYMGLLRFNPTSWGWVETLLGALKETERDRLDMTGLLRRLLERNHRIQTVAVRGGWCEVDSPSDLELCTGAVDRPGGWSHDWR